MVYLIIASYVTSFWIGLSVRRPVALWLDTNGLGDLAGTWGVLWMRLPDWIAAFTVGRLYRCIFGESFYLPAVSFCLGMIGLELYLLWKGRRLWIHSDSLNTIHQTFRRLTESCTHHKIIFTLLRRLGEF